MRQSADDVAPSPQLILLGRIGVVALVGLIGAAGFGLLLKANRTVDPILSRWTAAAGLGLLLGFATRHGLRGNSRLLRVSVSVAALALALEFLGVISAGDAGLLLAFRSRVITPNWDGLVQIALGSLSALLVMGAWGSDPAARRAAASAPAEHEPAQTAPGPVRPAGRQRVAIDPSPASSPIGRPRTQTNSLRRRVRSWLRVPSVRRPKALGARPLRRWRRRVRIVGAEEDRCPYCLTVIERNDARGVVVCPVCHTRHHADCWAVTGMCQVPHYHR